jgi:hypothetical protein
LVNVVALISGAPDFWVPEPIELAIDRFMKLRVADSIGLFKGGERLTVGRMRSPFTVDNTSPLNPVVLQKVDRFLPAPMFVMAHD